MDRLPTVWNLLIQAFRVSFDTTIPRLNFLNSTISAIRSENFLKFIFSVQHRERSASCILITLIFTCGSQVFQNIDIFHLSFRHSTRNLRQHKLQRMRKMWKHKTITVWQISYLKQHGSQKVNSLSSICDTFCSGMQTAEIIGFC